MIEIELRMPAGGGATMAAMERRQLEYFLAVVDKGGFVKAAAALHVTQPALSQAIKHLERELGTELFHRMGHGVQLTPAGVAMVPPARQAIRDFANIRSTVNAVTGLTAGQLDIAALPTLAQDPGAWLLGHFHDRYPAVTLHIRGPEMTRVPDVAEMVLKGDCELGLTESGASTDELVTHQLTEQDYIAVLPPGVAVPTNGVVDLEFVLKQGLVVGPWWETSTLYETIESRWPSLGNRCIVAQTHYRESLLPLVVAGVGATLLPRFAAEMVSSTHANVAETRPRITRQVALIHRKASLSPVAETFRNLALQRRSTPPDELPTRTREPQQT